MKHFHPNQFIRCLIVLVVSCTGKQNNIQQEETAQETFVKWAKTQTVALNSLTPTNQNNDLEMVAKAIGDARVVAISEGFHNCKEMLQLHERLIRYLIEEKGFTIVMTESGMPESREIYNYIQGGDAKHNMYQTAINKMYGTWQEGRSLIEWMRLYNQSHNNALTYVGADIGGFYKNWFPPVNKILGYLKKVDAEFANQWIQQLHPILEVMGKTSARVNYQTQLSEKERAKLAVLLNEAVKHMAKNKETYVAKWNEDEYQWACQSAVSMVMAENYYKNVVDRIGEEPHKYVGLNGRELTMATNVLWQLEQNPDAKIILINHVIHTKTKTQWQGDIWGHFTPMGQLIKQQLGEDYFTIGMSYGGGQFWNNWQNPSERFVDSIQAPKENGIEKALGNLEAKQYFISWKDAPKEVLPWLKQETTIRENDYHINMAPIEWDACFYLDEVSPATKAQ
jgi:erythromycin esterase